MLRSIRWKVLVALLIAVAIPLGASIYFFNRGIVRAYSVALNEDVEEALRLSVQSQREVFDLWKCSFKLTVKLHARDRMLIEAAEASDESAMRELLASFLAEKDSLVGAALYVKGKESPVAESKVPERFPDDEWRKLEVRAPLKLEGEAMELVEVYTVPWQPFHEFEETGRTFRTFETSLKTKENITQLYYKVYIFLVGGHVLIALLIAYLYTWGFSRRIKKIAGAASAVGKGDLDIQVNDTSWDEVGELGRNFDRMVRELRESRERINYLQKISAWQEIARRLAHEIKNPLTPIQLSIQQMKSKYGGDDEGYRHLLDESAQIAQEEIDSLRRLVSEFSGFARLPGVHPEPCRLNETMTEVLGGMDVTCRERGVTLEVKLPSLDVEVKLDKMMIKRVMDNLIMNGIEAIERAKPRLPEKEDERLIIVEAQVGESGEGAVILVSDRDKVFMPYFTKRKGGTGLGLPIVKKIILEHDGEIELADPAECRLRGACFRIELPLTRA
jgi:two-component system nitrogen regulation sensor histidine kinase NtrY